MGDRSARSAWAQGGVAVLVLAALLARESRASPPEAPQAAPPIAVDAEWEVLEPVADLREVPGALESAARALGDWRIEVAGVPLDGPRLHRAARRARREPVVRAVREELRRAFHPIGLLRFLDDVLVAGEHGRRSEDFVVTAGRARAAGILVHPEEIFAGRARAYPAGLHELHVDRPPPPGQLPPARDGEPLGPRWASRYPSPDDERALLGLLRSARPDYAWRIASLMRQLRAQGAEVELDATVRRRERGYLMWGAFVLSQVSSSAELSRALELISRRNDEWSLNVPIRWEHPDGWEATRAAAREMADAYDVVFASEDGAHHSNHYTGVAVDLTAVGLPRRLRLVAPGGVRRTFRLDAPDATRDLSLTPALIDWIEQHFAMRKLRSDYPHWEDARP
jgi:hypothetical protein